MSAPAFHELSARCGRIGSQTMKHLIAALAVAVGLATSAPAFAQAPDAETLAVARQLVKVSGSGRTFDEILPNVADQAKTTFIRSNPQMQLGIIEVVDRVALSMVDRRRELDDRLAEVWIEFFDKAQMDALLAFYNTPAGQRLAEVQPRLLGGQLQIAQEWAQEIGEEIVQKVTGELDTMVKNETSRLESSGQPAAPQSNPQ